MKREEDLLECPVCWESFNIVENIPCVLWCGHTLCKNCVLGLQWAAVKFPSLPIQLPLFISCPWCQLLSFRLVWKGNLKFPRKNFFLLWMVESMNGNRTGSHSDSHISRSTAPMHPVSVSQREQLPSTIEDLGRGPGLHLENPVRSLASAGQDRNYLDAGRLRASLRQSLLLFVHLTAKFPLVLIFLLIVLYVIPASAAILVVHLFITFLFAIPSLLVLYFSYPSLDWLVREITA